VVQHLDASKAQQLARAVEAATRGGAGRVGAKDDGRDDVPALLALYYRHVAPEDIVTRDPVDLCGAALSHQQMAQERLPGQAMARAFTPTVEENGWASGHTLVQVVTDDMPSSSIRSPLS
jgi:glutamate dehydrogenase